MGTLLMALKLRNKLFLSKKSRCQQAVSLQFLKMYKLKM